MRLDRIKNELTREKIAAAPMQNRTGKLAANGLVILREDINTLV